MKRNRMMKPATLIFSSGWFFIALAAAPLENRGNQEWSATPMKATEHVSAEMSFSQQYVSADIAPANPKVQESGTLSRFAQLEAEIRELRGELEQQSHKIRQLISLQTKLFQDLEQRLDALTGPSGKRSSTTPTTVSTAEYSMKSQPGMDKAVKSSESEQRAYQTAYNLLMTKQYPQAKYAMKTFLEAYPDGEYTVNAHYWMGELSLLTGDSQSAFSEFETVINKYPTSAKVSDAMLKVGLLYLEKGDQKAAKQQFQKLVNTFPTSPSANIAKKRLQTL